MTMINLSPPTAFAGLAPLRMLCISKALDDATDAARTVAEEDRA